jgi:Spy/CpxP family protein refolding chaperone
MKFRILLFAALFAIATLGIAANHGMTGHDKAGSGAQQPMPNLMRIIKMHGDQLNLSDEQKTKLATWREKSHPVVHGKLDEIREIRRELQNSVIDGANRAEINGYIARMDVLRDEIVATKLRCRNNMREILNDEQWEAVTGMYREKFM